MQLTIKPFGALTPAELYALLRLRCDVFVVEQACPYPEVDGLDPQCRHLLAEENGELIGCLRVLPAGLTFDEVSVGRVAVRAGRRGEGLARRMMEAALADARAAFGARRVRIAAQAYLTAFYASLGFAAVSDPYDEDGIPHVDMLWHCKGDA